MIDKTELLRMIMENNPGQNPAFILEQYNTYLKGLNNIYSDSTSVLTSLPVISSAVMPNAEQEVIPEIKSEEKPVKTSITCGYTKRKLMVKPSDAITRDKITCCICGKEGQTLTERHLATHNGLTREGYLKLCGYPEDQVLMSERHVARMRNNIVKAQEARKAKKKGRS